MAGGVKNSATNKNDISIKIVLDAIKRVKRSAKPRAQQPPPPPPPQVIIQQVPLPSVFATPSQQMGSGAPIISYSNPRPYNMPGGGPAAVFPEMAEHYATMQQMNGMTANPLYDMPSATETGSDAGAGAPSAAEAGSEAPSAAETVAGPSDSATPFAGQASPIPFDEWAATQESPSPQNPQDTFMATGREAGINMMMNSSGRAMFWRTRTNRWVFADVNAAEFQRRVNDGLG